ncbi:UDP-GlcNAc:betaGal beta-1,3-N-acetylglucosaminyltransferase-like protein 1, partial [Chelonia mydas]
SVILPVRNTECWLDECLKSVVEQDFEGTMELSVFNDASKDNSINIIEKWKLKLEDVGIRVVIDGHDSPQPQGVGFAKNQAVIQSSGTYLCFLDSDDVMMPQRVRLQYEAAIQHPNSVGGKNSIPLSARGKGGRRGESGADPSAAPAVLARSGCLGLAASASFCFRVAAVLVCIRKKKRSTSGTLETNQFI